MNGFPSPEHNKEAVLAAIYSSAGTLYTRIGHWRRRPPGYLAVFSTFASLRPNSYRNSGLTSLVNRNGIPHLTPNGYRYDGKVLTLITRTDRLTYRNLQRHNRISVCIDDPPAASNYVVISGTATWNDQDIWDEAHRIIARYRAPAAVDGSLARWQTEPRVLITVTPERISTRAPGRR